MKSRERFGHGKVDRLALIRCHFRQRRIVKHTAFEPLHEIEFGAQNRRVVAEGDRSGNRDIGLGKGSEHPEFAVDRMRTLENVPARLLAQYIGLTTGTEKESRIGLTAGDVLDRLQFAKIPRPQPGGKCGGIDCQTQRSYLLASSRSTNFWILPVAVFGSSSNTNFRGILNPAR